MLQIIVDESVYSVWALNTAVAQNRLIENLQSAFPQMLVENPARVKQCVRIALQVQLNHYKQLEASEGVFITKPGWHTDRNDELVYYVGPIRYAVHTETVGMADSLKKYRVPEQATAIAQQQECDIIMELAKIPCPPLHMAFLFQIAAIIKPLMERAGIIDRNPILYLYGEAGSGKTRLLRLVNSLYLRNDGDREIFEIPLRSWKNSLYGGMQEASGTVVILDDLAGSNGVQSEQDAKKLKELIMALGNGALPLRGTEGKESRVDFLAAVTANSILDYTLEILERICIVCVGQGDIPFERIQQIIGRDPSPLAGIYLQLIRHIVSMSAVTAERFTIILTSRNQSFTGMDHSTWVLSWRWMKQARTTLMRSKRCGRLTKKMYMAMSNRMAA